VLLAAPLAAGATAQADGTVTLDPNAARQGTALVIAVDQAALSPSGQAPTSITVALVRGMRVDTSAREQRCSGDQAARGACPLASRIGSGRYVMDLRGFLGPGGSTQLAWAIDAYLGAPARRGDVASVVLSSRLLGADSVDALVVPAIGGPVPSTSTITGRLVRRASGPYGLELRLPGAPVQLEVPAPTTATPSSFELTLSAARRTRQNFIRRYRVRTPSGYEIRKVRDHRLVGHDLLRTPRTCRGSWPYELSVGSAGGTQRTTGTIACTKSLLQN
jgi:hypothetical protein